MKNLLFIILFLLLPFSMIYGQLGTEVYIAGDYIVLSGGTSSKPIYMVVNNPNSNALLTPSSGWIISENEWNIVQWNIGAFTGNYTVPFGYSTTEYLPLSLNIGTAGVGSNGVIKFSTYHTAALNSGDVPSDVTNVSPFILPGSPNNTDDSYNIADRFYIIDANTGYSTLPAPSDITFSYIHSGSSSEVASPNVLTESNLMAERFNSGSSTWSDWFGYGCTDAISGSTAIVQTGPVPASDMFRSWALWDNLTPLPLTVTAVNILCNGNSTGSATVTVYGGVTPYTYSWAPSGGTSATASGLSVGTYTVTVSDNTGCSSTASISITQPTALIVSASVTANVSCNGENNGSVSSTPSGGTTPYTYSWSGGGTNSTYTGLTAGTYTVTVTDNNGCSTTASTTVTQPATLTVSASTTANVLCNGESNGSVSSTPSGGTTPYTYSWSGGGTNSTETGLTAGTYTITVTDNNGCTATASTTVTQPTTLTVSASATYTAICYGNSDALTSTPSGGTSPYTYSWLPVTDLSCSTCQNTSAIAAGSITYTVTVTDNNGCTATSSVGITVNPNPNLTVNASPAVIAPSGTSTLTVSGASTYSWSPGGATTSSITVSPSSTTTYTVTGTNSYGCSTTAAVTVIVGTSSSAHYPPPILDWIYTAASTIPPWPDNIYWGHNWIYGITEVHDQYGGYIAAGYTGDNPSNITGVILRFSPTGTLWWEDTALPNPSGIFQHIQEFKDNQGPPSTGGYHYVASAGNVNNAESAVDIADEGPLGCYIRHYYNLPGYFDYHTNSAVTERILSTGDNYGGLTEIIDPSGNNKGYIFATTAIMDHSRSPNLPPQLALLVCLDSTMALNTSFTDPNTGDQGYGLYAYNFDTNQGDLSTARAVKVYWDGSNNGHIVFTGFDQTWSNYQTNYTNNYAVYHELTDVYVQEVTLTGAYDLWKKELSPSDLATVANISNIPVINFEPGTNVNMSYYYSDYYSSPATWESGFNWGTDLAILNNYSNSSTLYVNTECNEVTPYGVTGAFYARGDAYKAFQDIVLKIDPATGSLFDGVGSDPPNTSGSPNGGIYVKQFDGIDFFSRIVLNDVNQGYAIGSNLSIELPTARGTDVSYPNEYLGTCFDIVQYNVDNDTQQFDQPYMAKAETYDDPTYGNIQKGLGLNCIFGFGATDDGGFLLGGNSELNNQDYIAVKLKPGCNSGNGTAIDQLNNPSNISKVIPFGTQITSGNSPIWTSNKLVQGYIEIRDGGKLTIDGAHIAFAEPEETGIESKIVVDTGGILLIENGATITSITSCDTSVWDGIDVAGTYTAVTQTTGLGGNSGWVNFTTTGYNDTVSNADTAIETIKRNVDLSLDLTHTGGLVTATSTNFTDNYCGIKMYPYSYSNSTYFTTCNFLTDGNQPSGWTTPYAFGYLQGVNGVDFTGSTFENSNTFSSGQDLTRGDGIIGSEASFNVQNLTSSPYTACTFSGLYYGIYASSVLGTAVDNIEGHSSSDNNQFTNNYYDIYENNINNSYTYNNTFSKTDVGGWQPGSGDQFYGEFLDACTGYSNYFNTFSYTGSTVWESYGIIANNSGSASNLLDYNAFSGTNTGSYDMYVGEQAQSTNSGLEFLCNTNTSPINYADIVNAASSSLPTQEGSSGIAAGNVFSQTCSGAVNIYNDPSNSTLDYYYYGSVNDENPNYSCTSTNITTYTAVVNPCSASDPTHRPSHFDTIKPNYSIPYDAVFVTSLKMDRQSYYNVADSLSKTINNATDTSTHKQVQEEINFLTWKIGIATNDLVSYFVNDAKLSDIQDSAIVAIQTKPGGVTTNDLQEITNLQISAGEYNAASVTLDTLSKAGGYTYSDYCELMPIIMHFKQDKNGYYGLRSDKASLAIVKRIALDTTMPGSGAAKSLLAYVYNKQYPGYIYPLNSNNTITPRRITSDGSLTKSDQFELYPNPAINTVAIEYGLGNNAQEVNLILYDVLGNKVADWSLPTGAANKNIVNKNISSLSPGVYYYVIFEDNKPVYNNKLVIVR